MSVVEWSSVLFWPSSAIWSLPPHPLFPLVYLVPYFASFLLFYPTAVDGSFKSTAIPPSTQDGQRGGPVKKRKKSRSKKSLFCFSATKTRFTFLPTLFLTRPAGTSLVRLSGWMQASPHHHPPPLRLPVSRRRGARLTRRKPMAL